MGSGGKTPDILNLGCRQRWMVGYVPRCPLGKKMGEPQSQSGPRSKYLALAGIEHKCPVRSPDNILIAFFFWVSAPSSVDANVTGKHTVSIFSVQVTMLGSGERFL